MAKNRGPTPDHPYRGLRQRRPRKARSSTMNYYSNKPVSFASDFTRTNIAKPDYGPGGGTSINKSTITLAPAYSSRSGSSVPGFKQLIRDRGDAGSGYSRKDYTAEVLPGVMEYVYYDSSTRVTNTERLDGWILQPNNTAFPNQLSAYSAALDAQAQTAFLAKIYQKQTTFTGGIVLGELRKTVHDLRHPLSSLYSGFFKYVKAVKTKAVSRSLKNIPTNSGRRLAALNRMVSNTWLEFQYGWRPLVSDMESAIEAYSYTIARLPVEHVQAKATGTSVSDASGLVLTCGYYTLYLTERTRVQTTVKYTGGLNVLPDAGTSGLSAGDLGVALKDFVPTVWELLPYSFLVDYFVNVGQVLEASMANTSKLYYCTKSVKNICEKIIQPLRVVDQLGNVGSSGSVRRIAKGFIPGSCVLAYKSYDRYVIPNGTLSPSLRVYTPLGKPLRLLNMAALVSSGKSVSNFLLNLGRSK